MIKNYKTISTRYIKKNKKRTILTLIGIILSLSLVSTIGLFITSAEKSQIEDIKRSEGVSFHMGYSEYTEDILTKVSNNPSVEKNGIIEIKDTFPYKGIDVNMYKMDKGATELFKYSIKEGRMPENENEVAIDEWAKNRFKENINLEDKLTIEDTEYIVVGFLRNDVHSQREKSARVFTFSNNPKNGRLLVEISEKADFNTTLKNLTELSTKDKIIKNHALIRMKSMESNKALKAAACIAVLIVVSATIIVIYNSFQINVAERLKQFGLLRSIGATKKQIKKIVFREATILLIIAMPIGIAVSLGAIYGVNYIFKLLLKGNNPVSLVSIDLRVILGSIVITILAVYISSLIPANFVGKISPLAAISSRVVIKKDVIKRKKYPILKKVFSYRVIMAIKNIRRNPGRCQIMILSIVVSSALFITFTSFMDEVFTVKGPSGAYEIIDLEVSKVSDNNNNKVKNEVDNELVKKLNSLSNVDKVYTKYSNLLGFVEVPENKKIAEAGDIYKKQKFDNEYKRGIDTELKTYDKVALQEISNYLISGEVNVDNMKSENGVILVDNGKFRDNKTNKPYIGKITNYKVGDEIIIIKDDIEFKVKVMAIVKDDIFERESSTNVLKFITSNEVIENITKETPNVEGYGISLINDSLNLNTFSEINNIVDNDKTYTVINCVDINQSQRNSMIMIKVLVYGFISVIALISSINIINTITMNITLRRRESAMLKSIGMSQKDLKTVIKYEGLFYGIFGGTIGVIIGCLLSYSLSNIISDVVVLQWKVPWELCIITILVAMGISYLSTLIPMKKIEKDNVIEVIREE